MFLLLLRSGRVFGHGRQFSKCSPFGACSHSPSLLSLQMSPPSSSLSPSSAHTLLHNFKLTSVLTPRAAAALLGRSSFGSVLYTVSLSLSLSVFLHRQAQLPYGPTLPVFWQWVLSPRVFFTTQLGLIGPEFPDRSFPRNHHPQDSAWCIYLYYPNKPATLRAFCKLDVS